MTRRPIPRDRSPVASPPSDDPPTVDILPPSDGIPAHVWTLLQQAGEAAAERLRDLLTSPGFPRLAPTAQARLIELAFVRAYGLPVRRSVEVKVDGDAVAASLAALAESLPERRPDGRQGSDTGEGETLTSEPLRASRSYDA